MKSRAIIGLMVSVVALGAVLMSSSAASADPPLRTYRVTIENLTSGQPLSPGVAVTHRNSAELFDVGDLASAGIEAIAEDGNEAPAVAALSGADGVTDLFDINRPITPNGTVVGMFTDTFVFEIDARPGDRLSLATMLICTNDGFSGLDSAHLPAHGSVTYHSAGYDAGTEDNTEASQDIVDPCSGLGPAPLAGDPDGNDDASVEAEPHDVIRHHPNIQGGSDLSPAMHGWDDPVAAITIERVD